MKTPTFLAIVALLSVPAGEVVAIDTAAVPEPTTAVEPWVAEYEGEEIDLRFGWDSARACSTDGVTTTCYDSESEMTAALGLPSTPPAGSTPPASGLRRASCDSFLRLYTGTNFTGSVLALTTRAWVLNLSDYGFNNVTSSYKVGGCAATFYDLSNANPPVYGGGTWAWAQASSMLSGWDNRVSSVWIS